ncbi:L-lactate permease [Rothia nasimurium]|uniref:L-lactate permease n=1 Tax=Rothia nasimurium TaxID=85336 RepID=A0A4Y9F1C5_9MICC|nr:lactate permease LctP family transporter [Rothia nasimurium]MBF0808930.1 lactate permease LctP family transporter [Rothia nasimurium]TFU21055.1 L-lactate permease [Rothia nasimurium]
MWQQVYDPLNNQALSALVAAVPILVFLLGLTVLKMKGLHAALVSLASAVALAVLVFGMPFASSLSAIGYGFLSGMWPIGWIVLMAVWLYRITVRAGNFEVIRGSVSAISADQRIQVLLIAFCFGGFLEGAAGFGIPIAICAALLVNLGFEPVKACLLALVSNVASGAYGAIGIPVLTGSTVSGVPQAELNSMMVWVLQIITIFIPVLLVMMLDGVRGLRETGLVALGLGVIVSAAQAGVLLAIGPELVDIVPYLLGLILLAVTMMKWQPAHIYREPGAPSLEELEKSPSGFTFSGVVKAWSPFIILSIMILLWSTPLIKALVKAETETSAAGALNWTTIPVQMPALHGQISQVAPIVAEETAMKAVWNWTLFGASGTAILFAALITIAISNISWKAAFEELGSAWKQLWQPILLICLVMAVANVMNFGGMSSALALALAAVGSIFPLFSPIIGWIGVFVTGSVVNNNTLFAGLQATTASQIGANSGLLVAANTAGGVMAKVVSPQSIAIAAASVNMSGQESKITNAAIKYSLALLVILCVWVYVLSLIMPA